MKGHGEMLRGPVGISLKLGKARESFFILWALLLTTFISHFIHVTKHMTVNCFSLAVEKDIVGKILEKIDR